MLALQWWRNETGQASLLLGEKAGLVAWASSQRSFQDRGKGKSYFRFPLALGWLRGESLLFKISELII